MVRFSRSPQAKLLKRKLIYIYICAYALPKRVTKGLPKGVPKGVTKGKAEETILNKSLT